MSYSLGIRSPGIGRQKLKLMGLLLAMVGTCVIMFSPAPVCAGPTLESGRAFPHFTFTDVDGKSANTRDFEDRIIVLSVAGRNSSDRFMKWMRVPGLGALRARPHLKFAYISIADVTSVPKMFKGVARKAVRYINRTSNEELLAFYKENDLVPRDGAIVSHLIPDWEGKFMARFGLKNANKFQCWLVSEGRIVAALPEGTTHIVQRYLDGISEIDKRKAMKSTRESQTVSDIRPAASRAEAAPSGRGL